MGEANARSSLRPLADEGESTWTARTR